MTECNHDLWIADVDKEGKLTIKCVKCEKYY